MILNSVLTIFYLLPSTSFLLGFLWYFAWKFYYNESLIRGPIPLPIIGNAHLLRKYSNPFEGFTALSKIYGDIYTMYLGSMPCVVVNKFSQIKEVLIRKGTEFGGRPDYIRYHKLFGGDRNNSLALCDWSELQKQRRHIARVYCSPRNTSQNYQLLTQVSDSELDLFIEELSSIVVENDEKVLVHLKPLVLSACANMLTQYMCSTRFDYQDENFQNMVRLYDEIFWDINQGYAVDFLPWLLPFYQNHMTKLSVWSSDIRKFLLDNIVNAHLKTIDYDETPRNFTDALLQNLKEDGGLKMDWQQILYELEDFIGGHSALGNLVMLTLMYLAKYPYAQTKILQEIISVTNNRRNVSLGDKSKMVYTEAAIFETLRLTSSPIVPHVATQDTDIDGKSIKKGTCVILNNYELNTSSKYWTNPEEFLPERFIKNGMVVKPAHFIPFGTGKRTCMGQQLVQGCTFAILAGIIQNFEVSIPVNIKLNIKSACVALPPDTFPFLFKRRVKNH